MKKSEFSQLVKNSDQSMINHVEGLENLVQNFPFFSSAQLLLTKAYQDTEDIKFENQLRLTAAYAANRIQLHDLLFNQSDLTQTSNQERKERKPQDEQENIEKVEEDQAESEKTDILDQQILTEAIQSSILQEVDEEAESLEESKSEEESKETSSQTIKEDDFNEGESHSFGDWISHYSETELTTKPLWENSSNEAKQGLKAFKQELSQRPKQEFFSASKMARLSVQEDGDLVTETLAKIYAQQGNIEKAIQAYQKLSLKYPEKKIYFAGQIEKLKDQLK